MVTRYAPGKVILFGEHAVVYGRPAIAVPLCQVRAQADVEAGQPGMGIIIRALDLRLEARLDRGRVVENTLQGLQTIIGQTLDWLGVTSPPDVVVSITSTIPIASGLGSGAAVSSAIARALAAHLRHDASPGDISNLVYQSEMVYHGTPSGIDNTVIAYERPVYFVKGQPIEILDVAQPLSLVVGNTGVSSPTRAVVTEVRQRWEQDREGYEQHWDAIGRIAADARVALTEGRVPALGNLMNENQQLLQAIDVSSPELDKLIAAARRAGALGAKLCGAGRGGNMVALCAAGRTEAVATAVQEAGAANVIVSQIEPSH